MSLPETAHPWEVLLTRLTPAAEAETLEQRLLSLLKARAEEVNPIVVRDLISGQDFPLCNHQDLREF